MLKNKKGIIFGIANDHSIAWGIAKNLNKNGAKLSITYQNETLLKRVKPLADQVECELLVECDFNKQIRKVLVRIEFYIHIILTVLKALWVLLFIIKLSVRMCVRT